MRVLGRIRLSRLTEESTSAARQRELIEQWSTLNGHEVIGWAEDLDVSGSVDPFDTPALGPWLRERHHEWDILCAWKLDRIGRRAIPLNKLFGWVIDHDKTLVCVSDNIDLSTWVGRLVANVIAGVAEGELESIRERTKASRKKLLESGRWPGGQIPFGFTPVQLPDGGWKLALHPEQSKVLRSIYDDVIAGKSVDACADKHGMRASGLWKILASKYLMGYATLNGQTVRDKQGMPVLYGEPLLTSSEWDSLQAALEARKVGPRTRDTAPMSGVIKCYDCGGNLYHRVYRKTYGKKLYRYYHCPDGHCAQVDADMVEEQLEKVFLDAVGGKHIPERVFIPASSHTEELEDAKRAVTEITALLGSMSSATVKTSLIEQMNALDTRIGALEKLPCREAGWELKETDVTYREAWVDADQENRRQLLLKSGIHYRIKRIPDTQVIMSDIYIPDEILELLS